MAVSSLSASVQTRDDLIREDFIKNWEELLGLSEHLRDKERKAINKAFHVIKFADITTLIQTQSDTHGIVGGSIVRNPVKNIIYVVFFFSCGTAVVYEVNYKKMDVMSWGHKILSMSKDAAVLEGSSLPSGSGWMEYYYTFPLQCINCSIRKDADR